MNDAPHYVVELAGILVSLAVAIVLFLYQRQIMNADAAADREAAAYKAEVHEDFQKLHVRLDDERTQRENLKDKYYQLELDMKDFVKRSELNEFYDKLDKIRAEVLSAVTSRGGQ